MEYTHLGSTGMEISRICLGSVGLSRTSPNSWALKEEDSKTIIEKAIELGINFFDTAPVYNNGESESIVGECIQEHRDSCVVATKINPYKSPGAGGPNTSGGLSRKAIKYELNNSLDRMGLDFIDLYQLHFMDEYTPLEQTLRGLNEQVEKGRINHYGASSSMTYQFSDIFYKCKQLGFEQFQSMQNHYNLVYREEERDKIPFCKNHGIGLIPYSSLARGYLARPHEDAMSTSRSTTEGLFDKRLPIYASRGGEETNERVQELAEDKGASMAQIAISWLLNQEVVDAPIVGVSSVRHLEEAVEAVEIRLSDKEIEYLEEPYQPKQVMGPTPGLFSKWKSEHNLTP